MRVKTTLDDDEIQDIPEWEWDIFEERGEEPQPPTEEEEEPAVEPKERESRGTDEAPTGGPGQGEA